MPKDFVQYDKYLNRKEMLASTFMQSIYASLTQQGSTLLMGDDALLTFINFALTDIVTYE